ncbi:MAG: ABC transporter permease [Actinomycetia bacterium]|nr:ABC transporter permease [Actinomycetes bacterium]
MRVGRLLLRRILFMVPILFGIVTVTFFATRVVGGDPAVLIVGQFAGPEAIENVRTQLGTNRPLGDQYVSFLADAARLDFGISFFTGDPVEEDLAERLPITLELVILSLALSLVLGVGAGSLAAWRAGSAVDATVRGTSFALLSLPEFWFGMILIYIFFFQLGLAPPPTGQLTFGDPIPRDITGAVLLDAILTANPGALKAAVAHAALPVVTLGVGLSAPFARLARAGILEALESDHMRFGCACGLSPHRLRRYAIRAALPPVVTFGGILFSVLLGGAVLVETVFSWGGAGQYAADAITQNDYPAIQAFVVVAGVFSVLVFLIVDLLYVAIDPRVKL